MAGKQVQDWTLGDIEVILRRMRSVHKLSTDEIIERFSNVDLVTLHQRYIVWKRE